MARSDRHVPRRHRPWGLTILHEDRDVLVVVKEPGLLTMSFHPDEPRTAERILNAYVRKGASRSPHRVYVVHRLDRETSGVLIFARSEAACRRLKDNWPRTEKFYLAAVHGHCDPPAGVIASRLAEDGDQFVRSVPDAEEGRPAATAYAVVRATRTLSIVKVRLLTGRKNQVRVHFAEAGHPVVGDPKYGRPEKVAGPMALHAKSIAFDHPVTGARLFFSTPIPALFHRLAGGLDEAEWERTVVPEG